VSRYTRTGWRKVPLPAALYPVMPTASNYQKEVADGHLNLIIDVEDGLFHLSISHRVDGPDGKTRPGRYPSWDEIYEARYEFCPPKATMAMYLPTKEEYVNIHPTTFHLWEVSQ